MDIGDIEVFIGIDVGKSEHWATALSRDGQEALDRALPNDEDRLREVYRRLQAKGQMLVAVDQPAIIGALAVAMTQDVGITVGYPPGLLMCRIADLTPSSAKTDAKDVAIIAQTTRTMPHALRTINTSDEDTAALSMFADFDLDLARQVNQTADRIRGLYTQIYPALEQVLGLWLEYDAALEVVVAWSIPANLKRADKVRTDARLKKYGRRRHATWADQTAPALEHQTVAIAGTDVTAVVLPRLARQLIALHAQRADVAAQVGTLVQAHLPYRILTSIPGIGVRAAAIFLAETLGKTFNTGAQLAFYARLAPITRHSGSSIRGEHVSHGGSKRLKRAMFLSIFASLRSGPVSRAYYQHRRDQGKCHNQAVFVLTYRRILTLYAVIRNGVLYNPQPATKLSAAA